MHMDSEKVILMSKINKVLLVLGSLFLLLLIFNTVRLDNKVKSLENQKTNVEQTAKLEIGRAHTQVANAESRIKFLSEEIQKDIQSQKAMVDSYTTLEAKYNAKGSGTLYLPGAERTIYTYVTTNGGPIKLESLPFEFNDFRLHVNGDAITKTFSYTLKQKFEVQLADTKLKSGAHNHYAELYELDESGKRVGKLELTKFEVIDSENEIRDRFKFFDVHLDLGVAYDVHRNFEHGIAGGLGLSLMSYGKPSALQWRFLRASVGLNKSGVFLGLSPVQYNLGGPLPLFSNLWLTPELTYNLDMRSYGIGLGFSVIL